MELEELQAIWETQTDRPFFAVNAFGLQMELYRTRERARQQIFWRGYFVGMVGSLLGLTTLLTLFVVFYIKNPDNDFPMNAWDTLAFFISLVAILICGWSLNTSWRKYQKAQLVFAPSLRQEIYRGIALIDLQISPTTSAFARRYLVLVFIAATLVCWEVGRLNGNPLPWNALWYMLVLFTTIFFILVLSIRQEVKQALQRKGVLESLLAKIDETPTGN